MPIRTRTIALIFQSFSTQSDLRTFFVYFLFVFVIGRLNEYMLPLKSFVDLLARASSPSYFAAFTPLLRPRRLLFRLLPLSTPPSTLHSSPLVRIDENQKGAQEYHGSWPHVRRPTVVCHHVAVEYMWLNIPNALLFDFFVGSTPTLVIMLL